MTRIQDNKLLSGVALAAALSLGTAAGAADTIKVGGVAPLSAPGSYQQGQELVYGLEWAVDDVNAAGGLLGKQVELIIEDTRNTPAQGATAIEKLITHDGVVGVAGEYHSSVCKAEIEVFHQHRGAFRHRVVLGGFPYRGGLRRGLSHQCVLVGRWPRTWLR